MRTRAKDRESKPVESVLKDIPVPRENSSTKSPSSWQNTERNESSESKPTHFPAFHETKSSKVAPIVSTRKSSRSKVKRPNKNVGEAPSVFSRGLLGSTLAQNELQGSRGATVNKSLTVSARKSLRSVKTSKISRNLSVSSSPPQLSGKASSEGKATPKRKRKNSGTSFKDKGRAAPLSSQTTAAKRSRRTVESKAVPDVDPYALTPDKSGVPAYTIPTASAAVSDVVANDGSSAATTKKGKFFTLGREIASKCTAIETFESLKQKLPALSRSVRRPPKSQTARAREEERARIAATTIWLPVPPQVQKMLQQQQSQPIPGPSATPSFAAAATPAPPGPLPTSCEGKDANTLSAKATIRMSDLSSMVSPIARNPPPPQLESTAVMNTDPVLFKDRLLTDTSNLSHRSPWSGEQMKGGVARRISFAQPLSPIRKRSPADSKGSSSHSLSASKIPHRNDSRNQDASEYEDFLEKLNSQLKPYEDFELTLD